MSDKKRTVAIVLKTGSTYYTGAPAEMINEVSGEFTLQPKESKSLEGEEIVVAANSVR